MAGGGAQPRFTDMVDSLWEATFLGLRKWPTEGSDYIIQAIFHDIFQLQLKMTSGDWTI